MAQENNLIRFNSTCKKKKKKKKKKETRDAYGAFMGRMALVRGRGHGLGDIHARARLCARISRGLNVRFLKAIGTHARAHLSLSMVN